MTTQHHTKTLTHQRIAKYSRPVLSLARKSQGDKEARTTDAEVGREAGQKFGGHTRLRSREKPVPEDREMKTGSGATETETKTETETETVTDTSAPSVLQEAGL